MYIYYVYAYIRKSDGTPYYIGKGKNDRAFQRHVGVSIPKDRSKIIFLETNLSNIGACAIERRLIKWWGRKDLNTGILINQTDGGEGSTGRKMTNETKEKIRQANIGKRHSDKSKSQMSIKKIGNKNGINSPGNTGMKHTVEQRKKISDAGKNRIVTDETRKLLSEQRKGIPKPKSECPFCHQILATNIITRFHGERCKLK